MTDGLKSISHRTQAALQEIHETSIQRIQHTKYMYSFCYSNALKIFLVRDYQLIFYMTSTKLVKLDMSQQFYLYFNVRTIYSQTSKQYITGCIGGWLSKV